MEELGKLTRVELRDYWKDEARDFTPWLAKESNLELLSKELKMELEFEGREVPVGPYKADIVAKEIGRNVRVIIENQLDKTNHDHLGKILTYASGLDARILIWISPEFTEEHRGVLDFLNESVNPNLQIFGIEIRLWQIGNSMPAPQFLVVSRPNEYTESVGLTETEALYLKFWQGFRDYLESQNTFLPLTKPYPQNWYTFSIGRSECSLAPTITKQKKRMGCELYIGGVGAGKLFLAIEQRKEEVEDALGEIDWQELPDKQDCRIVQYEYGIEVSDENKWPSFFKWMKERSEEFHKVFHPLLKDIQLPEENGD